MAERLNGCVDQCRRYLEAGSLDGDLRDLLEQWTGMILLHDLDLIGLSIMYPRQVLVSLALAKFLADTPRAEKRRIVLGGATVSALNADEMLKACPFVDAVCGGEGEAALRMLCRAEPFERICGLSYRVGGRIVTNRQPNTLSLTEVPMPSFASIDLAAYFNPSPVLPVVFSRGCMWRKCRFCAHNFSYSGCWTSAPRALEWK